MLDTLEPRDAVKLVENSGNFTPKERQKLLALALVNIAHSALELSILWDFSKGIAKLNGHTIPDFDPKFVLEIAENPSKFKDYR